MKDPVQLRGLAVKLLVTTPCIISAAGIAARPVAFSPLHYNKLQYILAGVSQFCWMLSPLFTAYTVVVAVAFLRRKDLYWSATAFLLLGLSLQQAALVAWFWVRGLGHLP